MSDYMESLFQGIDILIDKKLENLAYDTTVICTILEDKESKNGKYKVTDGSVSYIAYSDQDDFRVGDQVRVTIPQGDYAQKKFIIGKYTNDESVSPITYVSPLDSIVNISGNLMPISGEYSILANGPVKKKVLWNQRLDPLKFKNMQSNGIYNTLILKAEFKSFLQNYNYVAGTYGLRVDLLVRPSIDSSAKLRRSVELSSDNMFGNPYSFAIFAPQAKTFSIVTSGIIEGIELSLYQSDNFINERGDRYVPNDDLSVPDNIFVKNIELGFGSNLLDVEDNQVRIYSDNSLTYNYNPNTDETNRKKIGLVWYNKDENNKYIGFSDGLYDNTYSELQYLTDSHVETRLLAQKGRENIPIDEQGLNFAANIEEAVPVLYKLSSMITQDLCGELNYFISQLDDSDFKTALSNLKTTLTNNAIQLRDDHSNKLIQNLQNTYQNVLQYVYEVVNGLKKPEDNLTEPTDYLTKIFNTINTFRETVQSVDKDNFLEWVITQISNPTKLNAYDKEINVTIPSGFQETKDNCLIRVKRIIGEIRKLINTLPEDMLPNGADCEQLIDYRDTASKDRFIPYAESDFSDRANKYAIYWYRYTEGYTETNPLHQLMPKGWERINPNASEFKNPNTSSYTYQGLPTAKIITSDGKEVYAPQTQGDASFIYPYMRPDFPQEKFVAIVCYNHAIYKSNELVFLNSQKIPDKNTLDKSDILKFEHKLNSSDDYLIYTDFYCMRDSADEHKPREIQCHYDGHLAKDEALVNAGIYWYIPKNNTMLTYDLAYLTSKGFDTDGGATLHYSKTGYICFYKQIQCSIPEGKEDQVSEYNFSSGGQDDRSFWYKIKPQYNPAANQNHILCRVIPEGDIEGAESGKWFAFGVAGTNGTKYTLAITNTSEQCAIDYGKSDPLILNMILKDSNNIQIPLETSHGPKAEWYIHQKAPLSGGSCNYNSGKITISSHEGCGIIKASVNVNIKSNNINEKDSSTKKMISTKNLEQLYAVPWSSGAYYLSGPTYIIYNSLGTLDKFSMIDLPYKLYNANSHSEVAVSWNIKYYNASGIEISEESYMPTLVDGNKLQPSNLYIEGIKYMPVVTASLGGNVIWKQPIIIIQNRYGSPLLNEWSGNFEINEANGTIMSTMLGAGRKNANNTFDGILMGNVRHAAGIGDELGLYGFNDGAQSFGLKIDGTAFFGKSGSGRILFDGNKGTITSASYKDGSGQGMIIDLDDGVIELKGTTKTYNKDGDLTESKSDSTHSKIKLDIASPYFTITSAQNKTLMKIADKEYYLRSDNYVESPSESNPAAGMNIDLIDGHIDAYNFKLTSKHVIIDSSSGGGYLQVRDNLGNDLLYVSDSSYVLQSSPMSLDGKTKNLSSMKIDLANGSITASGSFKLSAGDPSGTGGVILSSSSPYLEVGKSGSSMTLSSTGISINTSNFSVNETGYMTAKSGKIAGWTIDQQRLYCETYFKDDSRVTSKSEANIYYSTFMKNLSSSGATSEAAFGVYKYTKNEEGAWDKHLNFYVTHAGKLNAVGAYIQGEIHASTGVFTGTVYASSGTFSGTITASNINTSTINGATISGGTVSDAAVSGGTVSDTAVSGGTVSNANIQNGSNFSVDENGNVTIKAGTIKLGSNFEVTDTGKVTIKSGSIDLGNGSFHVSNNGSVTISKGTISIGSITIDTNGIKQFGNTLPSTIFKVYSFGSNEHWVQLEFKNGLLTSKIDL